MSRSYQIAVCRGVFSWYFSAHGGRKVHNQLTYKLQFSILIKNKKGLLHPTGTSNPFFVALIVDLKSSIKP
jgi:hypothetical protein